MSNEDTSEIMHGVEEYAEEMDVSLVVEEDAVSYAASLGQPIGGRREYIHAKNEAGHNCTCVDFEQVLEWAAKHRPAQYAKFVTAEHSCAVENTAPEDNLSAETLLQVIASATNVLRGLSKESTLSIRDKQTLRQRVVLLDEATDSRLEEI